MTVRTWNGSTDAFTNGADWSPTGVPVSGDTAAINSGTVLLGSTPSGVAIQLAETAGQTASTTLTLTNVTLDASTPLTVINDQTSYGSVAPTINVNGTVTFSGTASFYGSRIQFGIASGAALVNSGVMNFYGASPVTSGAGTLVNSGTVAILNPNDTVQIPRYMTAITGTGQIALGTNARVEFDSAVASTQTLVFNDGASGNQITQLNAFSSFGALIRGFSQSDQIAIVNTPFSSATYTANSSNTGGVLSIYSGATLEGSLNFQGNYALSSFNFTFNDFGSGQSNLVVTTTATNAVNAGLPTGYQSGMGSSTPPAVLGNSVVPVYRFFNKNDGTHFFTANTGERDTVLATLPNMVQETNGFGAVQQSDPNATAVYRFFDTKFGTHFFTSSAAERDTAIATRPDLTYEAANTFYEHSTKQSGDIAVYRFFDTTNGTHFYTGSDTEYAGLTTPNTTTYRPTLTPEGVGFYAPAGSFT